MGSKIGIPHGKVFKDGKIFWIFENKDEYLGMMKDEKPHGLGAM